MISVIIPVYCVEAYLLQCLDSVVGQSYQDLEILLVDDGSTDKCGEICDAYSEKDPRIRVFHTDNNGLSAARNLGIQEAKGEYIGFIDSDDWIDSDMYELLHSSIEASHADVAVCGFDWENRATAAEDKLVSKEYVGMDSLIALLEERINNNAWNKLYRRELFQSIRFPEGKNYEDVAVMHQILNKAEKVVTIAEHKYHYCVRSESITKTYTASNLIDYADAQLCRYWYFREELEEFYADNQDAILCYAAKGICKVWRWWYGCSRNEKKMNVERIKELQSFSKANIPLFGKRSWPRYLRISAFFMRSRSRIAFSVLYKLNQLYRRTHHEIG